MEDFKENAKEAHSFDELAKGLANGTLSRRRALKLLGATLVSTLLVPLAPGMVEARVRCPSGGPGCGAFCRGSSTCICIRTTEGATRCVIPSCGGLRCQRSGRCPRGQVCAQTARRCCGTSTPLCVRTCSGSAAAGTATEPSDTSATSGWNFTASS